MTAVLVNGLRVAAALVARPTLWPTAVALLVRLTPSPWDRRGPLPSRTYLSYRGQAVYGMPLSLIPPEDVIRYLQWCRSFPGPVR
ncbi:MAG: hypothetical protein Q8K58_12115 [Acidimicrobiales bacterium]|nr:hypothetical protein [Acidimicrobiales bacterium]